MIGSPKLPWQSCALILVIIKKDTKNILKHLLIIGKRLPHKYTTVVIDIPLHNLQ
jgi:hypothetical protein